MIVYIFSACGAREATEGISVFCRDCARFDEESGRCRDGKVNPRDWETAVSVSQIYGLRAICVFNDHRERLVHTRKPIRQAPSRVRSAGTSVDSAD